MASGKSSYTVDDSKKATKDRDYSPKHKTSPVSVSNNSNKPTKPKKPFCGEVSESSTNTQFYRKEWNEFKRITEDEYLGISESVSGSSDTFHCVHGPTGKQYTEKGLLKRNFHKELDPIKKDSKWEEQCPPAYGWEMAKKLEFLVTDPTAEKLMDRIVSHLYDFVKISECGFKIDTLDSVIIIIDHVLEAQHKVPAFQDCLMLLLKHMDKPILLNGNSDVITHFEQLRRYMGFLGYLMLRLEEDALFDVAAKGLAWQLTATDKMRGHSAAQLRHSLAAAGPVLCYSMVQMLAVAPARRFDAYLNVAFVLACDSAENCFEMARANIIEIICYRFNPYFPDKELPEYEINPADPQDIHLRLGESSVHIDTVCTLLLVILKTLQQRIEQDDRFRLTLPCPDEYGQRCFVWAYRYECRAQGRKSQRISMAIVAHMMLHVYRARLAVFGNILMPEVMAMSVMTEIQPCWEWMRRVNFTRLADDTLFKEILIKFSVDLLKVFPYNRFMVDSQHWLVGLMCLVDPGLSCLRVRWSNALYAELRRTSLQAMTLTVMLMEPQLVMRCGLIRRLMWYIEWYSESPYELFVLYWCVRLLQTCLFPRHHECRSMAMQSLFDTHGIIIITHLCNTLLSQKAVPVEKSQLVLAQCTKMLASSVGQEKLIKCYVYPELRWPTVAPNLARDMLDVVLYALDNYHHVNLAWILEILNFIWESVVWKPEPRKKFVADNGIYKLLDLVTMNRYPVQCMALALVSDIARAGAGVGHLVTWRASLRAESNCPQLVKRGSTIVSLLVAVFKKDCDAGGVVVDEKGVIQDTDNPLFTLDMKKEIVLDSPDDPRVCFKSARSPHCLAAADLAGSRWSKAFAIFQMLTEDLLYKVEVADEAYKLYKDIKLSVFEENILVLVSHFLTVKFSQAWQEAQQQCRHLVPEDEAILEEFIEISKNYIKDIKHQQEDVMAEHEKSEGAVERDLHAFTRRVLLTVSLDALRDVRCHARSSDLRHMAHELLYDAVRAYHLRAAAARRLQAPVIRTYGRVLDEQNVTGQNVKVHSIQPRDKPKPVQYYLQPTAEPSVARDRDPCPPAGV